MNSERERITPEKAMEILNKDGLQVTLEQSKLVLEFLYQMADIVVEQYIDKTTYMDSNLMRKK